MIEKIYIFLIEKPDAQDVRINCVLLNPVFLFNGIPP